MLYEIVTTEEEIFCIRTDLNIQIWIEEFEQQSGKVVAEYDRIDSEDSVETTERAAA